MCVLYQLLAGGSVTAETEPRLDLGFMRPGGVGARLLRGVMSRNPEAIH